MFDFIGRTSGRCRCGDTGDIRLGPLTEVGRELTFFPSAWPVTVFSVMGRSLLRFTQGVRTPFAGVGMRVGCQGGV
jgi:hypothetical protein